MAKNAFCRSPPDRACSSFLRLSAIPVISNASSTFSRSAPLGLLLNPKYGNLPCSTRRSTEIAGIRWLCGSTASVLASSFGGYAPIGLPFRYISPCRGISCLAAAFNNVDFPQPLGPTRARISPVLISREISCRTVPAPYPACTERRERKFSSFMNPAPSLLKQ